MKPAWILFGAMFCASLGHSVLVPVLPALMRELGLSALQGGLLLTGSSIVWVIFCPWWGRRSDVRGRKPFIMLGLTGLALGVGLFALVMQAGLDGVIASATLVWLLLMGARVIGAALHSAAAPATQAYIADVSTGQQRTAAMGILSAAKGLGSIAGPALGALVVSLGLSLVAPIFLSALTPLVGMLLVWRLLPQVQASLKRGERAPALNALDPRLLPLLLISFCAMMVPAVVTFTIGYLVQDRFGLDTIETTRLTGLAVMASGVALFFAQIVLVQVLRLPPLKLLRLGMPLALGSLLLLAAAASSMQVMLAMALMGLGIGMVQPGFRSAVTFAVEPHEQGAAAGLASSIPAYSYIIGPALGTALYGVNPVSPFLLASLVMLAGIAVLVLHPRTRALQPAI
ncbi:MAG: MFS transporter [Anaerolineaceae bacterium]|nr:MFS transporter [Anaerolineaceae bacterium]